MRINNLQDLIQDAHLFHTLEPAGVFHKPFPENLQLHSSFIAHTKRQLIINSLELVREKKRPNFLRFWTSVTILQAKEIKINAHD